MVLGKLTAAILAVTSTLGLSSAAASDRDANQVPPDVAQRLEALITVYTNVYYALGACDGFVAAQDEAPADPYGSALSKWPDSFKHQMAETREEGRVEAARLARQRRFALQERAELCKRQLDSANADLAQVLARYGSK